MYYWNNNIFLSPMTIAMAIGITSLASQANAEVFESLDCVIEPHEIIDIASRVDGIVDVLPVERGDAVVVGQVLAVLDSGVEEAAVAAARSRARASAELNANGVSVDFAKRRRERLESLFDDNLISGDQMDEATTEAVLSGIRLDQAKENRRLAELELARSIEILERHTIASPIDGVVLQRYLAPGESTEDQPIMRIAQIDPLRIEVIVPVTTFGSIQKGQLAYVYPEAPKEGKFPAHVTIVDRVADPASGTFRVRLSMPNPDYAVPSGLNCNIEFQPGDPEMVSQTDGADAKSTAIAESE
jgi:RND family efflux transporter MFP subunit